MHAEGFRSKVKVEKAPNMNLETLINTMFMTIRIIE